MIEPYFLIRVAAWPPVALLLLAGCALTIVASATGNVSPWFALLATLVAAQVVEARREVKRYRAWLAEWDAMGKPIGGKGHAR
jgi:hypothetical protein